MQVIRKKLIDVIAWDIQARFIIPRWQRHYVWGEKEVLQMWSDWVSDCAHDFRHFCGVMLFRQLPDAGWEIVDGQQRMTTFFLFFLALRDICKEDKIDFSELDGIFTLPGNATCRLILQEGMNEDRDIMNSLLNQSVDQFDKNVLDKSALYDAYRAFRQKLADMPRIEVPGFVVKVLQNVDLVVLTVDEADDTRRIFESLNSRGKQVSPDELLSNLITYIGADDSELNDRAKNVWSYVSERFDHDDLELFLDTFGKRNGIQTDRGTAFEEIKFEVDAALKSNTIKSWFKEFMRAADNYNDILYPGHSDEPIEKLLSELKRLRVPKLNPFLLALLETFRNTPASEPLLHNILAAVVRLLVTLDRPSYRLEKFTADACLAFDKLDAPAAERLEHVIKLVDEIWVDDATFRERFIKKNIYGPGAHLSRLRYYLEKFEQKISEESGTPFEAHFGSQTTVEHIMPQNLDKDEVWKGALRISDPVRLHSQHKGLVHTIGNLTVLLTKDNPAAGNAPYSQKRDFYIHPNQTLKNLGKRKKIRIGNCALNSYFENVPTWNFQTIVNRGQYLADLALIIWNKEDWNRETQ
jgi:uncharacterized protein with ParB-like and HNH nuclease domain